MQAAWRTLELRHYDVQIQGALALSAGGTLAQMGTGEGKTLVATCAVSAASGASLESYGILTNLVRVCNLHCHSCTRFKCRLRNYVQRAKVPQRSVVVTCVY